MLTVPEAQQVVWAHTPTLPAESLQLNADLLGLVIAEDVASDIDTPPFDKAMMDGYAVRSDDLSSGQAVLQVVEEVRAGQTPTVTLRGGQATRIMTGAPIPDGADAVVMVERTRGVGETRVEITDAARPEQNILRRGREMRVGDIVIKAGSRLRPQEFGLLASVGRTSVRMQPAPRVAILATGDELVDPGERPGPGQIRNSNACMLAAQVRRAGGVSRILPIARDNVEHLRGLIGTGLADHVLVLSGGVSAGKVDLVPDVLRELGVHAHFHKVQMKPGKPIYFGVKENTDRPATLVFGLPGNPVSSLVCFELFVRLALRRLQGQPDAASETRRAELVEDFAYRTDRTTWHPAQVFQKDARLCVRAAPWFGSADLRGVLAANAFVVFPAGDHVHKAGQTFEVLQVE